jgi:hypothetical protein
MDASMFDELTRAASEATSRRGALTLMAGAALAAVMATISPVAAKKHGKGKSKHNKKKCRTLNQSCGGKHKKCCPGQTCTDGACACPSGTIEENGTCVSPPPGPACTVNTDCGVDAICVGGSCVQQPPPGPECTVNNDCGINETCQNGACVPNDFECAGDGDCGANEQCQNGFCECPEIEDGRCIRRCDVQNDCPGASQCQNLAPEPSPIIVDGVCVDQPFLLCDVERCTTNDDCQSDEVCVMQDCDGPDPSGVCYPFSVLP